MSDAIHKNILAIKAHSEDTRALIRDLERKVDQYSVLHGQVQALAAQVQALQVKVYSGGATS